MTKTEAQTRLELIDKLLGKSGWNVKDPTQVVEEFDIPTGFARRCCRATDLLSKAINSAITSCWAKTASRWPWSKPKRPAKMLPSAANRRNSIVTTSKNKMDGELPFCFYTNGHGNLLLGSGKLPARKVFGFPTRDDLERFQYIRRNRKPLTQEFINTAIAGRDYQIRAIRAVMEGIEQKKARISAGDGHRNRQNQNLYCPG